MSVEEIEPIEETEEIEEVEEIEEIVPVQEVQKVEKVKKRVYNLTDQQKEERLKHLEKGRAKLKEQREKKNNIKNDYKQTKKLEEELKLKKLEEETKLTKQKISVEKEVNNYELQRKIKELENKIKSIVKVKEDEKVASKINQEFSKQNELLQIDEKEKQLRELANMYWNIR